MKIIQFVRPFFAILALSGLMLPAACGPKVDTGGYVQENAIKDQITVGQSTREDVKNKLGSPSVQSSFGDEAWYYITNRKETLAFFKPKVVQEDVVRIDFDSAGVVSKVETFDKSNGEEFAVVSRTTPTEGHTLGFFEQVLGNIGRFNHPGNENSPSNSHGAPGGIPGR